MIGDLEAFDLTTIAILMTPASVYALWTLFLEIRFVLKLADQIQGYARYTNSSESEKLFLNKVESLCLKSRAGVDRNYKNNIFSLEQSMEIKDELDILRNNFMHGPRGKLEKVGFFKRRRLMKLDYEVIKSINAMISLLDAGNNEKLARNCLMLIKEVGDALTRRTLLVTNTGD